MNDDSIHILIVEDEAAHAEAIRRSLRKNGNRIDIEIAPDLQTCRAKLADATPDIVLLDLCLPDGQTLEFLKEVSAALSYPILIMTSQGSETLAVEALKSGALDYIVKSPESIAEMPRIIERSLREWRTRQDHQQAVEALRESESRYRHLFQEFNGLLDAVPDSFMLLDAQMRILWANRAAAREIASAPEDLIGEHCYNLLYKHPVPCENCLVQKAFATGEQCSDVVAMADDRIFDRRTVPLCDASGVVTKVIHMKRDITEQKQLASEADRASRLAVLGELSAGVAHEINNPNALILYNSEILERFFKDLLPHMQAIAPRDAEGLFGGLSYKDMVQELPQLMTSIHDSARRIKRIVNDLRDFSRQDRHDQNETLDVNKVVKASVRLVNNAINKVTDHFELRLADNLPPLRGVSGRLEQVIINLLLNACQALESRSQKISVTTAHASETHQLLVTVVDEGQGMSSEVMEHLFEPFMTTKRSAGGTGLGLSVSSRIIKEHGGSLNFTSTPGKGTTATLTLPIGRENQHVE